MESQINILLLDKWKTNFFPFDDKKNVSLLLLLLLLLKWQTEKKLQYGNRFNCNQWQCWCFHHVSSLFRACQRARAREMKKIIHTHNTSCWLLMFFFLSLSIHAIGCSNDEHFKSDVRSFFYFPAVAATFFLFHSIRTFVRGALHFVMHGWIS